MISSEELAEAKSALALGFRRIGTYTLKSEPGTSLRAAGWTLIGETPVKEEGIHVPQADHARVAVKTDGDHRPGCGK